MSDSPSVQYEQWQDKFVALTHRERVLSLTAVLAVILLGGFVLFVEPTLVSLDKKKMEVQRQSAEVSRLKMQVEQLKIALREDPDAPIKARLAGIENQITDADAALAAQTEGLVPANQMSKLLEQVFAQFDALKLMEMRSIAPTAMLVFEEEKELTDVNLFQHGVQITLQGSYFDIQTYLQRVEGLPYQFYWKKFDYNVGEYPVAEVQIEIYTLSTSRAFIGVWNDA